MLASNIIMGVIPRCVGFVAFCNSDKDSRRSFQNMVEVSSPNIVLHMSLVADRRLSCRT